MYGGTTAPPAYEGHETDFLLGVLADASRNHGYLFADQQLHVNKPPASGDTTVDLTASPAATAAWSSLGLISSTIGKRLPKLALARHLLDANALASNCGHPDEAGVGCFKEYVSHLVDAVLTDSANGSNAYTLSDLDHAATAKRALADLQVGEVITNFLVASAVAQTGTGTGVILRNERPSAPGDSNGGAPGVPSGTPFIARDPSPGGAGRSVLAEPDGTVLNIPDGGSSTASPRPTWSSTGPTPRHSASNPSVTRSAPAPTARRSTSPPGARTATSP